MYPYTVDKFFSVIDQSIKKHIYVYIYKKKYICYKYIYAYIHVYIYKKTGNINIERDQ